jgi:tetratricopeptide (TPR) repeat protein
MGQDEIEEARQHLDSAVALSGAADPDVCAQYAEFHLLVGDKEAARAVLAPALDRFTGNLNVALAAAQLARSPDEVRSALARLEALEQRLPNPPDNLYYLKSRLLERAGRYDEAIQAVESAHARRKMVSDLDRHLDEMDRIQRFFTSERFALFSGAQHSDPAPVFIVGMPRSGTTLAEQILASHPDAYGAGETTRLWELVRLTEQETGQVYPHSLEVMGAERLHRAAAGYLADLHALAPDALRICDKLPHNFLHLGLIQILFPRARVIYCRRNALDNCLSIFMHRFNINHRYAQSLPDLGTYYRHHEQLMDYWLRTLDLRIHTLDYEQLIDDQEGESRRLLAAAGLEWDDACLMFHENRRSVVTPSYDQVRQPLYRSSLQRWQHYEAHLQPLRDALQR